jgi:hypothetical protein
LPSSGRRTRRVILVSALGLIAILSVLSATGAVALPLIGNPTGLNDLAAIGQGLGQTPASVPTVRRAEPPLVATPRSVARDSIPNPESRVASPRAAATTACGAT